MNNTQFFDKARHWLSDHALSVALIIIVTAVVLKVAMVVSRHLVAKLFKGKQDEESKKLAHTITIGVDWLVAIGIVSVGLSVLLHELGVNTARVMDRALDWLVGNGLGIAIILALTFVLLKIAAIAAAKVVGFLNRDKLDHEGQKRADTLNSVMRWSLRTAILLIAAVMLLGQVGVQIGPIIAAAGVAGVAVGFGAQNLVQDVISGFFLLLEDQIRVGDVVQLGDKSGLVEKITLRMVILRDFSGTVHYVRNGKIDVVSNMTKEFSYAVFDIGIAYRENSDEVCAAIAAIGKELQDDPVFKSDILAPLEIAGLDKFGDSAVIIKARMKTKPIKQWGVGREFNRRVKKKFDELGIEIPFPHITVYPGQDKKGGAPALKVEVQGGQR